MAKKKSAAGTSRRSAGTTEKNTARKASDRKAVVKKKAVAKKASSPKKPAPKKSAPAKAVTTVVKKKPSAAPDSATRRRAAARVPEAPEASPAQRKKGVRKATISSGIRSDRNERRLGRSRIPVDAPLDVVFQNDNQAREAFVFLGIHTIRELEQFNPDELVMRLTSPAKQTVGRIRKILAMNNRALTGDEAFALEFQERLTTSPAMNTQ